jgi:RNA polymerase sigma-70 factor, ECF subfamily
VIATGIFVMPTRWSLVWALSTTSSRHPNNATSPPIGWHAVSMIGNLDDEPHEAADFDELFRSSYERLVRSVTLAIGDADIAADAVQEAFARAHSRWPRVSRIDSPLGWIRTVAINDARDTFRRRQRFDRVRHLIAGHDAETEPTDRHTPLTDALATLSPQQRIAATLYYLDDLSVVEVARTMKLSEGAVKFHLSKARDQLRSITERFSQ